MITVDINVISESNTVISSDINYYGWYRDCNYMISGR